MRNITLKKKKRIKLSPVSVKGTEESMYLCLNTDKKNSEHYLIIYSMPRSEPTYFFITLPNLERGDVIRILIHEGPESSSKGETQCLI